jgi:predicted dehydrogenase
MGKRLRIGIIGSGGIFNFGISHIIQELDFELVAIADPEEEMVRERWKNRSFSSDVPFVDDYRKLIADDSLDAVLIGLPSHMHHTVTLECLDAGLHVLCEKPPTENVQEITEVLEKVKKSGLVYQFVRQSRFGQMVQGLKQLVDSGSLGEVYYAKTEWIRGRWFSGKGWRHDASKGGGVLLDLGIHAYDNVWYALGCPRPVEVMATMNTTFTEYAPKDVVYTADDSTMAMIRFEDGLLLCLEVAFSMNTAGRNSGAKPDKIEWQQIHVYGDEGAYENGKFLKAKEEGVEEKEIEKPAEVIPQVAQVANFFDSIQGTAEPVNTVEHAVQLMQVLEAAKKSAEQGKTIRLEKLI